MRKILISMAMLSLTACAAKTYLEESKEAIEIPLSASYDTASEGVHLGWSVNWDNTTFQILRGTNPDNLSVYVGNAYQLNWVDTDADAGTEYYYLVKAFTQSGRYVGYTPIAKGYRSYQDYAKMHAPTEVSADQNKYGGLITLYWYGQEESRFRIYRSNAANGDYKLIAEANGLKYLDTNVRPKETWYYKISSIGKDHTVLNPIKLEDSQKERYYNGSEAGANSIVTAASVEGSTADSPVGVQATSYTNEIARTGAIQVSWDWDDQADYYRIYRSSTEDGEYKLIAPYSRDITNLRDIQSGFFNDKSMPNITGINKDGTFVYPEYFYQITAVKNNEESVKSLPAAKGSALDKKDVLPAPEGVLVKIKTAKEPGFEDSRLFPVINPSNGKYILTVTWNPLPASVTDGHTFKITSSNTVSKEVKTIASNLSKDNALVYDIENPDFNQEVFYSVAAVNTSKGGLAGNPGEFLYRSLTPMPPTFNTASQLKRVEITNEQDVKVPTHTQYKTGLGGNYIHRSVGWVSKQWTTTAVVGDIDLEFIPAAANMQKSYNIYRRLKTAGNTEPWQPVDKEAIHSNSIDDPTAAVNQVFNDNTLTEAQLKGSGTVSSISNFYPKYEYRITAVNDGIESGLTPAKEGQAINPKDILDAPSYLTVPFHYAKGTGIAFWSFGWTVRKHSSAVDTVDVTEGFSQIEGKSGNSGETQRSFVTWAPISTPSGINFDYRFRHVRSAFAALDGTQYAQPNYLEPGSWYTHGGMGQQTWIKLNNETSSDSMTYLYDVVDSGIAGVAGLPTYNPGSAFFAVSATNKNAGGLDGNTIGILYNEAPENPYSDAADAPKNLNAALLTDVYPYNLKLTWDAVSGAVRYSILTLEDDGIAADGSTNKKSVQIGTVDAKGSGNEYIVIPSSEFVLGAGYTYYVQAETTAPGEASTVVYTHKTPYKLKMVSSTTNKVNYTTNITTPNTVTWIENESFTDGASSFNKSKRNVGSVKKMWTVSAAGGTIDLHLSYGRFGSLPSSYNIQRRPEGGSWGAPVSVPITSSDGSAAYTDTVPSPGVYHYNVSAVYQGVQGVSGLDGATTDAGNYPTGVALDTAKLSPAPGYLNVPFHWAFGSSDGGYKLAINQISESPEGIAQINGQNHGGQALWLTWKPVSGGADLSYAARVAPGVSDIPSAGAFSEVPLASSGDTKVMISNHAGLGKTALYSPSENTRAAYRQDSAAFDVTVSNTFVDALGNTVTVAGGSKGVLFFESSDPYTEGDLAASSLVTATLNKEAYISKQHYELNLTWNAVSGAGAYTIFRRQGGADTFIATVPAEDAAPSSYSYSYSTANLTLGQSYDFVIVSTNLSPVKKGDSNFTAYTHYTPKPPVVKSITTNDLGIYTNLTTVDEVLKVYWGTGSKNANTGRVVRRWTITYTNKGIIGLTWAKGDTAENFDHYKIYRTTVGNAVGNFASSHSPAAWSGAALLTTASSSGTSHRDNTLNSMTPAQRQGSGTPFNYPTYYYRITAVYKDGSGNTHESLPSFYTNTGAVNGIAAGGSAINPDDIFAAPMFFNPLFSWNKGMGWGSTKPYVGSGTPNGFQYMPEANVNYTLASSGSTMYGPNIVTPIPSGLSSYPGSTIQPFFIAWGPSTNSMGGINGSAKFTLKNYFKNNGEAWPGWGFTMSYEIGTPTAANHRTYGHSSVGGGTYTKFFTAGFGNNGAALEVTSVNEAVKLDGTTPLQGESSGFWFNEIAH